MWQVRIHELVLKEDFKKIDKSWVSRILKIIYKKLSVYPEQFGSPLRHQLSSYRKLKISHYRVIYKIEKKTVLVLILKVGFRRDAEVYREMMDRLKKL
ncbi:MAG: plasmid stabilization protein [Elusimicrobia bacterium CG03_land_8_20_14_0_80_50_18]|nr:MAG: plasmid stabilization protein [Elusimicrobia bacterium CG03_land_8_20_14_0_80_50_18]PIX14777.1 MAG: plasmid stabilization protein [Elusimicrobia bacterium CG_4_8_14_3_um_filter_50_9]